MESFCEFRIVTPCSFTSVCGEVEVRQAVGWLCRDQGIIKATLITSAGMLEDK